jgi:hypothetical protein
MDQNTPEFQRAKALDQILKLIGSNSRGKQMLSTMIATQLGMPDKILDKLLTEETKVFQQIATSVSRMANGNATIVQLTPFGEEQYKTGWTFMKQLAQDELDAVQRRKQEQRWGWVPKGWNILLGATTILFAYLTWDATRENKIHDAKEERWEVEKAKLQSQIEDINYKYQAVPDSIRQIYK